MKLKELHADIARYLKESCYCPGEIYSSDGFFYQVYDQDDEIARLGDGKNDLCGNVIACVEGKHKQILLFALNNNSTQIIDAIRCDATDENIALVKDFLDNKTTCLSFNNFDPESDNRALKKLIDLSDAFINI